MFKSEYQANVAGFTCSPMARKAPAVARKNAGFNYIKAMGYGIVLLALLAVVY